MWEKFKTIISEHAELFGIAGGISLLLFLLTATIVPIMLVKLDRDYFMHEERRVSYLRRRFPMLSPLIIVLRNFLGVVMILAGLVMLITPGQGFVTILAGLMVMDFPGKFRLERRLIRWSPVNRGVNWLRAKFEREPLRL